MISGTDRDKLGRFAGDCVRALGADLLRAVLLHDAVDGGSVAGKATFATVVIVQEVSPQLLRQVAELARRWRRSGIATPLVLDDEDLARSCDVFPLEILALMDCHVLLWGARDPLGGLRLDHEQLRLEVEQQLKGKVLHLRQAYLECTGDKRAVRTLLLDSSAGFEAILRGLLMLAGRERSADPEDLTREVERVLGVKLATFRTIQAARQGRGSVAPGESEARFARYLEELTGLSRIADRITRP